MIPSTSLGSEEPALLPPGAGPHLHIKVNLEKREGVFQISHSFNPVPQVQSQRLLGQCVIAGVGPFWGSKGQYRIYNVRKGTPGLSPECGTRDKRAPQCRELEGDPCRCNSSLGANARLKRSWKEVQGVPEVSA